MAGYEKQRMTIEELAVVHGLRPSRVRLLLIGYGIPARSGGTRIELIAAERERRRDQRPIEVFIELYRAGRSVGMSSGTGPGVLI